MRKTAFAACHADVFRTEKYGNVVAAWRKEQSGHYQQYQSREQEMQAISEWLGHNLQILVLQAVFNALPPTCFQPIRWGESIYHQLL